MTSQYDPDAHDAPDARPQARLEPNAGAEESSSPDRDNPFAVPGRTRSRRELLTAVSLGLSAIMASIVAVPIIGALIAPLTRKEPDVWRSVGTISDFKIGDTVEVAFDDSSPERWAGVVARTAAWLRRSGDRDFTAYAINCTHLGCPVRWLQKAELFMCPCHGGVFFQDGSVAAGPPEQPLFVYPVRVQGDEVQIQTSGVPIV